MLLEVDSVSCLPLSPDKSASGKSLKGARDVSFGRGENDSELSDDESDFPLEAYVKALLPLLW